LLQMRPVSAKAIRNAKSTSAFFSTQPQLSGPTRDTMETALEMDLEFVNQRFDDKGAKLDAGAPALELQVAKLQTGVREHNGSVPRQVRQPTTSEERREQTLATWIARLGLAWHKGRLRNEVLMYVKREVPEMSDRISRWCSNKSSLEFKIADFSQWVREHSGRIPKKFQRPQTDDDRRESSFAQWINRVSDAWRAGGLDMAELMHLQHDVPELSARISQWLSGTSAKSAFGAKVVEFQRWVREHKGEIPKKSHEARQDR